MGLTCEQIEMLMADALSGRLSLNERATLQAHLSICADCSNTWENFKSATAVLDRAYPHASPASAQLWSRIEASRREIVESKKSAHVQTPAPLPLAFAQGPLWAAVAMLALAAFIFISMPTRPQTVAQPAPRVTPSPISEKQPDPAVAHDTPAIHPEVSKPGIVTPSPAVIAPTVAVTTPHAARGPRESFDDATGLLLTRQIGAVALFDSRHNAWRPLVSGERVPYGAAFRTGADAKAELAFGESRVKVDANTQVVISRDAHQSRVADLSAGRILVDLLRAGAAFRLQSGGGSVELTGTIVEMEAPVPNVALARVLEGHVRYSPAPLAGDLAPAQRFDAPSGSEILVAYSPPAELIRVLPDAMKSRAEALAKAIGRVMSSKEDGAEHWSAALQKPPAKSDAAVGQLIVKDAQGRDAEPLGIVSMDVKASIHGAQAMTEVDQVFLNNTDSTLEGTFYFPLPPGAAISRFAMYVDEKTLIEGEMVESMRARTIYESILRAKRDPALLEWMEGNLFKARIFPIPPRSEKRIILQYTQLLPAFYDTRRYVFPLVSEFSQKTPIGRLSLQIDLKSADGAAFREVFSPSYAKLAIVDGVGKPAAAVAMHLRDLKPTADFVLTFSAPRSSELTTAAYAQQGEAPYFLFGFQPGGQSMPKLERKRATVEKSDVLFLVETSGARTAQDLDAQRRVLLSMLSGLDLANDRAAIAAVDVSLVPLTSEFVPGTAPEVQAALSKLNTRAPLGALDLQAGLLRAAEFCRSTPENRNRVVVYLGAGVASLGTLDSGALTETVAAELSRSRVKFIAAGIGRTVDALTLTEIARRTGGFYLTMNTDNALDETAFRVALSLKSPLLESPRFSADGEWLTEIYPQHLGSLLPGQEVFLHGRLAPVKAIVAMKLSLKAQYDGKPVERQFGVNIPQAIAGNPAVGRFWARARLDYALAQPQSESLRTERDNILARHAMFETDASKRAELMGRAYEQSEKDAQFLAPLCESLMAAGKTKEAVAHLEQAVRGGNSQPWMWQMLVKACTAAGQADDALRAMTQEVSLRPREAGPRRALAAAFQAAGRAAEALREQKIACELAPEVIGGYRELLALASRNNDLDAREWSLLKMLEGTWLSQDGDVWGEATRGLNTLIDEHKAAGNKARAAELEKKLVRASSKDIVVVLNWDTNATDVDLHVTEPGGLHVNYQQKTSARGGVLDKDVTSGRGTETYTLKRAAPGKYDIRVVYYSGSEPTRASVTVTLRKGDPEEEERSFTIPLNKSKDAADVYSFSIPNGP